MKMYEFHNLFLSFKLTILAMPRVETRGSENEEESKQRCVTYEFIVWIISTFHPPLPLPPPPHHHHQGKKKSEITKTLIGVRH